MRTLRKTLRKSPQSQYLPALLCMMLYALATQVAMVWGASQATCGRSAMRHSLELRQCSLACSLPSLSTNKVVSLTSDQTKFCHCCATATGSRADRASRPLSWQHLLSIVCIVAPQYYHQREGVAWSPDAVAEAEVTLDLFSMLRTFPLLLLHC